MKMYQQVGFQIFEVNAQFFLIKSQIQLILGQKKPNIF